MSIVKGFKGLRYNLEKTTDLSLVITPPYDIITPEMRVTLSHRSKYSFVHIDLPEGENKYEHAGEIFRKWVKDGVLIRDEKPKAYWLRQRFTDMRGLQFERLVLLSLVQIPEENEETILPHEKTFKSPVLDRIALMEQTQAQLSPIFLLYNDPQNEIRQRFSKIMAKEPKMSFITFDGALNDVWITDWSEDLSHFFADKVFYIADGHHRFKTAQQWLLEKRRCAKSERAQEIQPYRFVFSGLVSLQDPGLIIYSPHRILPKLDQLDFENFMNKLSDYFLITKINDNPMEYLLRKENQCKDKFICYFGVIIRKKGRYIVELKETAYDYVIRKNKTQALHHVGVFILHNIIFNEVMNIPSEYSFVYETNPFRCMEMVDKGEAEMAFLLCPISSEIIKRCAECREYLPQKATYFFPKIPSGIAVYELTPDSLE